MSNDLVTIDPQQALQQGGVGMGDGLFRIKPQYIELVSKSTTQEGAQPGKFRVTSTNEHFDELRVVLLDTPHIQNEKYVGQTFNKDSKMCFSIDGVEPHAKAKEPPARYCANCPDNMGVSANWDKWRKTKEAKDLPACSIFYHLFVGERTTQTPYYINVKGKSVQPFKQAMEQQLGPIMHKQDTNIKVENKQNGFILDKTTNLYVPAPGATIAEGAKPKPRPNIFDFVFTIYSTQPTKGGPYVMGFKDVKLMKEEDRADFGSIFLEFLAAKQERQRAYELQQADASQTTASNVDVNEAPAEEVVLPSGPIVGEVVSKDEPITI